MKCRKHSYQTGSGGEGSQTSATAIIAYIITGTALLVFIAYIIHKYRQRKAKRKRELETGVMELDEMPGATNSSRSTSHSETQNYIDAEKFTRENPVLHTVNVPSGDSMFDEASECLCIKETLELTQITSTVKHNENYCILSAIPMHHDKEFHSMAVRITELRHSLSENNVLALGICAKPYPDYRMPGWHRYSIGLHSDDGHLFRNDSSNGHEYCHPLKKDDEIVINLQKSTGNVFFVVNGQKHLSVHVKEFQNLQVPLYFALGFSGQVEVEI